MNVLRPLLAVLSLVRAASVLQVAGLGLLTAAAAVAWGVVGGLTVGGVAAVLVGVALERSE